MKLHRGPEGRTVVFAGLFVGWFQFGRGYSSPCSLNPGPLPKQKLGHEKVRATKKSLKSIQPSARIPTCETSTNRVGYSLGTAHTQSQLDIFVSSHYKLDVDITPIIDCYWLRGSTQGIPHSPQAACILRSLQV